MKHVLLMASACLAIGCATQAPKSSTGTPNVETPLIKRGVTPEKELVAQMGAPEGRGLDAKGRKLLTWNRVDAASTKKTFIPVVGPFLPGSVNVQKRQLAVSFNGEGTVADYKVTSEAHEANIFGTTD